MKSMWASLLWWTWVACTWLGNRAHGGVLRAGSAVAMAAVFVVALTIPEAWHDAPGGLYGPVVLVVAFTVVRVIHLILSARAAADDTAMRRQAYLTWIPVMAGSALLLTGALLGGWRQTVLFAAALLADWGGIYLLARNGSWRIHSAAHWNERHGLFVILAIGESAAAIGIGAAQEPPRWGEVWSPEAQGPGNHTTCDGERADHQAHRRTDRGESELTDLAIIRQMLMKIHPYRTGWPTT